MKKKLLVALGTVAGLLVLAVVVLLAMGQRAAEGRNDHTVEIAAPPEVVWRYLEEPEKLKLWVAWLHEVRREPPGPDGVVRREVWVMDDPNTQGRMELAAELVEVTPPRLVHVKVGVPGSFDGWIRYELSALDGGRTRLAYTSHFAYGPWLFRLLEPLVTPQAQKKLVADLAKLKAVAEGAGT